MGITSTQETNHQPAWRQSQERMISSAGKVVSSLHKHCHKKGRKSTAGRADEGHAEHHQTNGKVAGKSQQRKVVDQDNIFLTVCYLVLLGFLFFALFVFFQNLLLSRRQKKCEVLSERWGNDTRQKELTTNFCSHPRKHRKDLREKKHS